MLEGRLSRVELAKTAGGIGRNHPEEALVGVAGKAEAALGPAVGAILHETE